MSELEVIKSILGNPFHETEFGMLYNMDCKIALKRLKSHDLIDCTITSPPYNIGKEYESVLPHEQYVDWLVDIFDLTQGITKKDGSLLLNVGYLSIENVGHAIPITYKVGSGILSVFLADCSVMAPIFVQFPQKYAIYLKFMHKILKNVFNFGCTLKHII